MSAVTVELPEVAYRNGDRWLVFKSTLFGVAAHVGHRKLEVWLADWDGSRDLHLVADEARSLAAALLAAADASEVA